MNNAKMPPVQEATGNSQKNPRRLNGKTDRRFSSNTKAIRFVLSTFSFEMIFNGANCWQYLMIAYYIVGIQMQNTNLHRPINPTRHSNLLG